MNIFRGDRVLNKRDLLLPHGILALVLSLGWCHASAQTSDASAKTRPAEAHKIENGKKIFAARGCDKCHGAAGQGGAATGMAGPRISPPPATFSGFAILVREPQGQMPPFSRAEVSDADLADVYAFLKFKPFGQTDTSPADSQPVGKPENGKALYMSYGCYDCHGRYAEGSTATGPRLNPVPVSLDDLIKYLRHPSGNMPPYTAKVVSDSELADIFAFLQSLPPPPKVESIPLLK